jgi:predicted RNA-binding protein with PIN domain
MHYLIDGYNLLFAYLGTPPSRQFRKALERARLKLLELLRQGHESPPGELNVIFDASQAPPGMPAEFDHHGIHVVFAVHDERADDLIEKLIRQASTPRNLTIVTDDNRIQRAAQRRHCPLRGCADYLDELERHSLKRRSPVQPEAIESDTVTQEETQHWLNEFADLQRDPAFKELADPFGFERKDARRN